MTKTEKILEFVASNPEGVRYTDIQSFLVEMDFGPGSYDVWETSTCYNPKTKKWDKPYRARVKRGQWSGGLKTGAAIFSPTPKRPHYLMKIGKLYFTAI